MKPKLFLSWFFVVFFSVTAFTACENNDDLEALKRRQDQLERELKELAQRLKNLEEQVNSINLEVLNLQALLNAEQNKTYITGIMPVFDGGVQIGYTMTFSEGAPITIYHGRNGTDGKDGENGKDGQDGQDGKDGQNGQDGKDGYVPLITVKKDTDGEYYWCQKLPGGELEYILDDSGNRVKLDVSGRSAYEIAKEHGYAGTEAQWLETLKGESAYEIACSNGFSGTQAQWLETLKGTPPLVGIKKDIDGEYYWTRTLYGQAEEFILDQYGDKIKATGEKGDAGSGACLFRDVDISDPSCVVFTMDDGVTKITVPRYNALQVSFGTFDPFKPGGAAQTTSYTMAGTETDVQMKAIDKPSNWTVSFDHNARTMTVDPYRFGGEIGDASITVLVTAGGANTTLYTLPVYIELPVVGTIYYENGVATGLVIREKTGTEPNTRGLILHKRGYVEGALRWAQSDWSATGWSYDQEITIAKGAPEQGESYMEAVMKAGGDTWRIKYPAFSWCHNLGEGWFLPMKSDLESILPLFGSRLKYYMQQMEGDDVTTEYYYWRCTNQGIYAHAIAFVWNSSSRQYYIQEWLRYKYAYSQVRAFKAF